MFIKSQYTEYVFGVHLSKKRAIVLSIALIATFSFGLVVLQPAFSAGQGRGKSNGRGALKAVGISVFTDSSLRRVVSSIDWGMINSGDSKNATCFVENEGTSPVMLSLSVMNWNPGNASSVLALGWDYTGMVVGSNSGLVVTFTLTASYNASSLTSFSFDTVVTGSAVGQPPTT